MPTVLRKEGFSFIIHADDHEPSHVHVRYQGTEVVLVLDDEIRVRVNYRMTDVRSRRAISIAKDNIDLLLKEWIRIHG